MMPAIALKQHFDDVFAGIPSVWKLGKVTRVVGLIVEGYLPGAPVGAHCYLRLKDGDHVEAEVIGLKGDTVVLMPLGNTQGIRVGDDIELHKTEVCVKVSDNMLGRIVDGSGQIMDHGPRLRGGVDYPLYHPSISAISRQKLSQPLGLGIRAMDGFTTCARGQRLAIMAGSGVGKSTLMGMIARNAQADVNVIGLVGERGREVREFIENDLGPEGLARSVVVVATSDASPLIRMRAAFVTTSIAEYFRDRGANVMLMMDSLTRFAMASREVGLSLGEPPTVKGYTPSLFSTLPKLLERAGTTASSGSITGLYTILTEGDDLQDPIADAVRAIVDGHIVLSRKLASMGHYPPIDVLQSLSRVMNLVVGKEHFEAARQLRRLLSMHNDMEDYIRIGLYTPGKDKELDLAVNSMKDIRSFLIQDVAEKSSFNETMEWLAQLVQAGSQ